MKFRIFMMRVGMTVLLAGVMATAPLYVFAATGPTITQAVTQDVFITEVQTALTPNDGSDEFVELYNNTNSDIDLADSLHGGKDAWKLQYFSASKFDAVLASTAGWGSPTGSISFVKKDASGQVIPVVIPAHDYFVMAGTNSGSAYAPGSTDADFSYSPHLSNETALQVVDVPSTTSTIYHDRVLWSDDTSKQGGVLGVLAAPAPGVSLQRVLNDAGSYVNDDNSLTAITASANITPKDAWVAPAPEPVSDPSATDTDPLTPADDTDNTSDPATFPAESPENAGLHSPVISELLPNPASPATDDQDEFIELYNPNTSGFNLKGYTLETGETTLHDFTFTSDTMLAAGGYTVFTSAITGLSLSNSGGQARLLDQNKTTLNQTAAYDAATDGQAWALDPADSTSWQWTTTLTPGAVNVITSVATTSVKSTTATAATKTAKKTTKAKVAGTKTTKTKAAKKSKVAKARKTKKATTQFVNSSSSDQAADVTPIHPWTLAVVAILAVAYGLYEYRFDLANRIYQFRKHRATRNRTRYALQGR